MQSVSFNTESAGPADRVRTARVGHLFELADGERLRVLAIDASDPTTILMEGGRMVSIPAGSIVSTEAQGEPKAPRTEKPSKRVAEVPPVAPVSVGAVRSITYHSGYKERTLSVGDLVVGSRRVVSICAGDPVRCLLLDAKGVISSEVVCGAGSVAVWKYA